MLWFVRPMQYRNPSRHCFPFRHGSLPSPSARWRNEETKNKKQVIHFVEVRHQVAIVKNRLAARAFSIVMSFVRLIIASLTERWLTGTK